MKKKSKLSSGNKKTLKRQSSKVVKKRSPTKKVVKYRLKFLENQSFLGKFYAKNSTIIVDTNIRDTYIKQKNLKHFSIL